jgi:hypothetical protein
MKIVNMGLVALACVIFLVGLFQRIEVPMTLGGGGVSGGAVGPPRIKESHVHQMEVEARQESVEQTVRTAVSPPAVQCPQYDKVIASLNQVIDQLFQKEKEEAERKDASETRKIRIQLVLTLLFFGLAVYLFVRKRNLETAALTILTAVLGIWGK